MFERNRPPIARTHYFSGESLLTADFVCEQHYNMQMLALLNGSLHTWGIASGLEVSWQAGEAPAQVTVSAGMAIDRLGRQIVLVDAQVLRLDGVPAGSTLYLTIRYEEVYADYSVESGVPGYKRIVQQPVLEYLRTLQEPGINILLAVITLSSEGGIDAVDNGLGSDERRYVGSRLGVLELVTQGSGIHPAAAQGDTTGKLAPGILFKALKESGAQADYLEVQAHRSQFSGMLTTRGSLGVGVDQPQANLQVERITTPGIGALTTRGTLLTLQFAIYPPLQCGDVITPELPVGAAPLQPRQAVIQSATTDPRSYRLMQPFQEDVLLPCRYNYTRMTLARFAAGDVGELLRIGGDGSVGLGVQAAVQSGNPGPAALTITADRRVGIALDTPMADKAALDVNGNVTCRGVVTAQSFEGNGSKLQNLPILSYWTKQDVASAHSSIYYNNGNVGVQMTNPAASLSVGTGRSFIGAGVLSADATDPDNATLVGNQTAFKTQLGLGTSIVLGRLMQQWRQIRSIPDDHHLELTEQFPSIIQQSAFQYAASGSQGIPGSAQLVRGNAASAGDTPPTRPGTGLVSSNGVLISGDNNTQFSKELKPGDWLVIAQFEPHTTEGNRQQWMVEEVIDDATVKVVNRSKQPIPANVSAFMVTPALIGVFQCNVDTADDVTLPPPPAMLVISNGLDNPPPQSNTVAINLGIDEVDRSYALQVNGDVDFSGGSHFNHLVTQTLEVQQWATIAGAGDGNGTVLAAGPSGKSPLLSVTQSSVLVGQSSGSSLLEIGGDAHATGNARVDGQLSGQALSIGPPSTPYAVIAANGAVSMLGQGAVILQGLYDIGTIPSQKPITWRSFSGTANTDGYIVASFGPLFPNSDTPYFAGWMTCSTPSGTYYATGGTFTFSNWTNSILSSLCAPVQQGQSWSLQIQIGTSINSMLYVNIYWVPLGTNAAGLDGAGLHASADAAAMPSVYQGHASLSVER